MSNVGKYLKVDNATLKRERLQFARVMVEVDVSATLLDEIVFENEKGEDTYVSVKYDWKPSFCMLCKMFGHDDQQCKKKMEQV